MYPNLFKEDLGSGLCCDALLAGNQNRHPRKAINNHKNIVISTPLLDSSCRQQEARNLVH
jgi:hypothetical protein